MVGVVVHLESRGGWEGVLRSLFWGVDSLGCSHTLVAIGLDGSGPFFRDIYGLDWRVLSAWALPGHLVPGLLGNPELQAPSPKYSRQAELHPALTFLYGKELSSGKPMM